MRLLAAFAAGLALSSPASAEDEPSGWAALARADLQGVRDLMAANHPGPVDPENPDYRRRLEDNLAEALSRTEGVDSYADYVRAVRYYITSFRDGHVGLSMNLQPRQSRWPGFTVGDGGDGTIRVNSASDANAALIGAALTGCDGQTADQLMRERVEPYYWNADLPNDRLRPSGFLFIKTAGDEDDIAACRFRLPSGEEREVALTWEAIDAAQLTARFAPKTTGPALRKVGDVWFVDLPTFNYQTEPQVAAISALVEELKRRAPELATATIVFDVRGNGGGNSAWANRVASALWGEDWTRYVISGFDNTIDYRVSAANVAALDRNIARDRRNGLTAAADSRQRTRDRMAEALARGEALLRLDYPPQPDRTAPAVSPFNGRAYLLTDAGCASACLDFADLVRRLPNTRHIGGPTSADAVYIDNTLAPLPSGLASLSYSLKVYRNRVRSNNQWYDPEIAWPKPRMTEAEIVDWVTTLSARPLPAR